MRGTPTGHAALRVLSEHLKREMPDDFKWDYGLVLHKNECGTAGCAIGLATTLWPEHKREILNHETRAGFFDMPHEICSAIFYYAAHYKAPGKTLEVTAADVARLIDHYLDHGHLPPPRSWSAP